jgi:hypothetical protein
LAHQEAPERLFCAVGLKTGVCRRSLGRFCRVRRRIFGFLMRSRGIDALEDVDVGAALDRRPFADDLDLLGAAAAEPVDPQPIAVVRLDSPTQLALQLLVFRAG